MSELIRKPWSFGDAAALDLREPDLGECAGLDRDAHIASHPGPKWTLWHNQQPVLCFGFHLCDGIATLWSLTSAEIARHPIAFSKTLRWAVCRAFAAGAHRVQALVLQGNERSCRWLQRFAHMRYEGLLRQFGPDRRDRHILAVVGEIKHF